MNSFAHYSFGAVYQWIVENLGGIRSDGPAYRHIVIAPTLDERLNRVRVSYCSVRGQIESAWERGVKEGKLHVVVPANATATIAVPAHSVETVTESGKALRKASGVLDARMDGNLVRVEVGSGDFQFVWKFE
jgi:alpha-L-rhamnosidase